MGIPQTRTPRALRARTAENRAAEPEAVAEPENAMTRSSVRPALFSAALAILALTTPSRADIANTLFRGLEYAGNFTYLSDPRNEAWRDYLFLPAN